MMIFEQISDYQNKSDFQHEGDPDKTKKLKDIVLITLAQLHAIGKIIKGKKELTVPIKSYTTL